MFSVNVQYESVPVVANLEIFHNVSQWSRIIKALYPKRVLGFRLDLVEPKGPTTWFIRLILFPFHPTVLKSFLIGFVLIRIS